MVLLLLRVILALQDGDVHLIFNAVSEIVTPVFEEKRISRKCNLKLIVLNDNIVGQLIGYSI